MILKKFRKCVTECVREFSFGVIHNCLGLVPKTTLIHKMPLGSLLKEFGHCLCNVHRRRIRVVCEFQNDTLVAKTDAVVLLQFTLTQSINFILKKIRKITSSKLI